MNYEKLTNYDKFVLAQNGAGAATCFADSEPVEEVYEEQENSVENDLYEKYLINELRRTVPSDRPVMRFEEFVAELHGKKTEKKPSFFRNGAEKEGWRLRSESNKTQDDERSARRSARKVKFPQLTKLGKIVLAVYVIMVVAVASILIVSNTTVTDVNFHESANASMAVKEEQNPSVIHAMSIEEDEEQHSDWFDKLCDSLNK